MTLDELIRAARARYPFRDRRVRETPEAYRAALAAHVRQFDFAAAHELRTGRAQADWTDADIAAFRDHLLHERPPRDTFAPGLHVVPTIDLGAIYPDGTEGALLNLAETALQVMIDRRVEDAHAVLPIEISLLLVDGHVHLCYADRGDRVATVRALARTLPVFGFVVVADAFVHGMPPEGVPGPATKRDAIMAHVGSRDLRRFMVRFYRVDGDRARFDATQPPDHDKRGPSVISDPFAGVFASEPPARPQ